MLPIWVGFGPKIFYTRVLFPADFLLTCLTLAENSPKAVDKIGSLKLIIKVGLKAIKSGHPSANRVQDPRWLL